MWITLLEIVLLIQILNVSLIYQKQNNMKTLQELLQMKVTMKNCKVLDDLTNDFFLEGKKEQAAFINLITTEMWVRIRAKTVISMEKIYNSNKNVVFNTANNYKVINPFENA